MGDQAARRGCCGQLNDSIWLTQTVDIFAMTCDDAVRHSSTADTKKDTVRVGKDLGKGLGVSLMGVMVFFLVKDAFGHNDGNCAIVDGNFG